jgi:Ca-activated chloride channel homolog
MTGNAFLPWLVFDSPWWLLSLLLLPVWWFVIKKGKRIYYPAIHFPVAPHGLPQMRGFRSRMPGIASLMLIAAFVMLCFTMARPQWTHFQGKHTTEGIDIVIAMDISLSMLARDFEPDRLEASKDVAARFVNERGPDRIGLVVFAGQPFTLCPLTGDKAAMITLLQQAQAGFIEDGSTAIGDGIATAVNRLRESDAKSKVIILLTDGENNAGNIDPIQAAEITSLYGIRLYTIGVGTQGMAMGPVQIIEGNILFGPVEVEIDEKTLKEAAELTGGKYFRAVDKNALEKIYHEIDTLEKSRIRATFSSSRMELYPWCAALAALFLFSALLIRYQIAKTLP